MIVIWGGNMQPRIKWWNDCNFGWKTCSHGASGGMIVIPDGKHAAKE
jgi:hypothetical protein